MSLIKKPNELSNDVKLKGLIYGEPGLGKTTLALSAPSPLLIDFDNGLRRVSKQHQTDSVQVENYQNLLDILLKEDISAYKTIIIDTLGKMIDRIGDWLAISNPKVKQGDGSLSMKGWGSVKIEFQKLLKLLDSKNKSVIFVAHSKEEKDSETTKQRPDVAGSSGKDIVKELDFMGFMSMKGGKRTIDLMPNEQYYAKNSLGLNSFLEFPPIDTKNNFLSEAVFEAYSNKLEKDNELADQYNSLISIIDDKIDALESVEGINDYYKNLGKLEKIWSSDLYEKNKLREKIKEMDLTFNKETKLFEAKEEIKEEIKEKVKND
ncbi:MAG: phage nucleotide-binding protein [Lentimonas sp.]|jgi:phage nucleotide-binding protein